MQSHKPAWWQLYLVMLLMIGLGVGEEITPLPGISREIVFALLTALMFGAMFVWVQINRHNLQNDDLESDQVLENMVIRVYKPRSCTNQDTEMVEQFYLLDLPQSVAVHPTQKVNGEECWRN